MAKWTADMVAARFMDAARTAHRLPPVRVQGYFNAWPEFKRMPWENLGAEPEPIHLPPTPEAIDRMFETMQWVLWLEEEQRHLVWMRAERRRWRDICARFGCNRTTAWRRWMTSLDIVQKRLN